ncbi:hypothetical protein LTR62_005267 [Meristemomyces frigidus]|uniref:Uncharacterized protein n=1 Tax=Meristemomyces frigidus TaxID=1508187 RepID=A0AAN7TEW5_9PEZI|nr:hypothetical protein LTR62_005267 [Meristemomyces frigidus]
MATQTVTQPPKTASDTTTQLPMADQVTSKVQSATTGVLGRIEGMGNWVATTAKGLLDRFFPPEQRASLLAKLQAFMLKNPKLSAFLGMNLVLTGVPLGLFILFTIVVAVFSLLVGLVLGLLGAVVFILFAVGVALCFVLPTIFFTTAAACFLFLWGLGGYYVLKWLQGDGKSGDGDGPAIGDRLNNLTGGKLTGFMDAARDQDAKSGIKGFDDQHTKPNSESGEKKEQQVNGTAEHKENEDPATAVNKATKATGVEGVHDKVGGVKGTATGGLGGATGLA